MFMLILNIIYIFNKIIKKYSIKYNIMKYNIKKSGCVKYLLNVKILLLKLKFIYYIYIN